MVPESPPQEEDRPMREAFDDDKSGSNESDEEDENETTARALKEGMTWEAVNAEAKEEEVVAGT